MRKVLTNMQLKDPALLLFSVLLLLYAAYLWQQSQPKTHTNNRSVTQVAAVTYRGDTKGTTEAANRFSQAFGATPIVQQAEAEIVKKVETLADLQPKLIAVDEVNQQLTARIILTEEQSRLKNIRLGDELAGYELTHLTLTQAIFKLITAVDADSDIASTITLEVFTQAGSEQTAASYHE